MVTVVLPTVLAQLIGNQRCVRVNAGTVRTVIDALADRHPELAPRLRSEMGQPLGYVVT